MPNVWVVVAIVIYALEGDHVHSQISLITCAMAYILTLICGLSFPVMLVGVNLVLEVYYNIILAHIS